MAEGPALAVLCFGRWSVRVRGRSQRVQGKRAHGERLNRAFSDGVRWRDFDDTGDAYNARSLGISEGPNMQAAVAAEALGLACGDEALASLSTADIEKAAFRARRRLPAEVVESHAA